MASRVARSALGAALRPAVRPALQARALPAITARFQSNVPQKDPKSAAQAVVDAVPGNSLVSKTGILAGGFGLSAYAISNEIYVLNEETIVMFSLLTVFYGIYKYLGPAYAEWADSYADKVKGILSGARQEHKDAVQSRIDNLKSVGEVVDTTKSLFAISRETAELEAKAYELEQKTALAAEAKSVLESWVRYESQLKQRQQKELAESIIAKINKELDDPKVLKKILDQAVADVERIITQAK